MEGLPDLTRVFTLYVYALENAPAEGREIEADEASFVEVPEIPRFALAYVPELGSVLDGKADVEALAQLDQGHAAEAAEKYRSLALSTYSEAEPGEAAFRRLGLAVAEHANVLRNVERAAEASRGACTLHRARCAAVISAFYEFLGEERRASEWRNFIERLPRPDVPQRSHRVTVLLMNRQGHR